MSDISEQILQIEKEIRETPYHKATEHHIGKLRARLAKLKDKQLEASTKSSARGKSFAVKKQGDASVVLIGPPSVGKSTIINKLTNTKSKVASYAFTTVTVIPGMMKYKDAYIQILDVPGLVEGAREGRGRGKEVLSIARNSDLLIIMSDVEAPSEIERIVKELQGAGIRVNANRPGVAVEKKTEGGIVIHSNITQNISKETIKEMASEFGLKNGEIIIKEKLTMDKLIDAFSQNRIYIPAIFVVNKTDTKPNYHGLESDNQSIAISAEKGIGINHLKDVIWDKLGFVRVYLVRPDEEPSYNNPIIMKARQSLKDVAEKIGTEFSQGKKLAKIWGASARFPGQEVSLSTPVQERLQIRFLN